MENTAASGAETQQNQPPLMESATPTSVYSSYYSDPQYALYYQQAQMANPNLQPQYDANGTLLHPPGVDPNPAVAYANASTYIDAQQLAYYYAAYPQAVASGPAATAAYYHQDPNAAAQLAYSQYSNVVASGPDATAAYYQDHSAAYHAYSNGAVMQPSATRRSANHNSALRGRRNPGVNHGVRKIPTPLKKRPKIAKVVQSAWCEVCKVDCNSGDVLDKHKEGKKHKKNVEKLIAASRPAPPPPPPPPPVPVPVPVPQVTATASNSSVIGPQENPKKKKSSGNKKGKRKAIDTEDLETKKMKMLEGGADAVLVRWCEVCNVVVNSETVYRYHLAGQKHAQTEKKRADNIRRLAAASAPKIKTTPPAAAAAETDTTTTNAEPSTATITEPAPTTNAESAATSNAETSATTSAATA